MILKGKIGEAEIVEHDRKFFIRQTDGTFVQLIFGPFASGVFQQELQNEYKKMKGGD